jgi:hypothetical protein
MKTILIILTILSVLPGCRQNIDDSAADAGSVRWIDLGSTNANKGSDIPFSVVSKESMAEISFDLTSAAIVTVTIFDAADVEVIKLIDGEGLQAGNYSVDYNASNCASGSYLFQLKSWRLLPGGSPSADADIVTHKILLVK